jgi:hypothetical protein
MRRSRYQPPKQTEMDQEQLPLDTVCTILTRQSTAEQRYRHIHSAEVNPEVLVSRARRLGFPPERIRPVDWDMGIGAYKTTIRDRRGLSHWLFTLLPSGESRVLLVSQEDRLFRDRTHIEHNVFIEQVAQHVGWVVCGNTVYNFRQERDKDAFRDACKYGKEYIQKHILLRLHPAVQHAAMAGYYSGGPVPWGYLVDYAPTSLMYKHFVPYEPHAVLVRERIFAAFAAMPQPSLAELSRQWERDGLLWPDFGPEVDPRATRYFCLRRERNSARGGFPFKWQQAQHVLSDVVYLGWRVRKGEIALEDDGIEPRVCHTPLVDPDLFWYCYDHVVSERPSWAPKRTRSVPVSFRPRRSRFEHAGEPRFLVPGRVRCVTHQRPLVLDQHDTHLSIKCRGQGHIGWNTWDCAEIGAVVVEDALCDAFVEHLTLDERDVCNLARLAQEREQRHQPDLEHLEQEVARHKAAFERAVRRSNQIEDEAIAAELFAEARREADAAQEAEQQLRAAREAVTPSSRAWLVGQRASALAERIRTTFGDWSRQAKARVLTLALEDALLGRVSQFVLGLYITWAGGLVSRRELVSERGRHLRWAAEEEELLRQHYARLSWPALEVMLPGHTHRAIQQHAADLGLSRSRTAAHEARPPVVVPARTVDNALVTYGFPLTSYRKGTESEASGGGRHLERAQSAPGASTRRPSGAGGAPGADGSARAAAGAGHGGAPAGAAGGRHRAAAHR